MSNASWVSRDLAHLWHPCTQMKDHEREMPLVPIRRARGAWLEDFEGRRYLDAISSWWVNLFGHTHPHINAAVKRQLDELEHVMLAGFTHEPAIRLAERLCALAPAGLQRCFYADSGAAAVEIAMKMSFHYWQNVGRPGKTRFVTLTNSYHGETLGALAAGHVELYKAIYRPLLMDVITTPSPDALSGEPGESARSVAERRAREIEQLLEERGAQISAVLVEPLVQCAGSMRMYDAHFLARLRQLCDRFEVHLIADEIAVGFGRTGTMFACEQAGIRPDFLCLSKGLSGGYLPMSAVLTTQSVYDAFYDEYVKLNAFLHSHSYSGNPLACAAALASLELFELEAVLERNRTLAAHMAMRAAPLRNHAHVLDVRQRGTILAIELARDPRTREPFPWRERRHLRVYRHALQRGVLLRPLGAVLYLMPPYVVTAEEIDLAMDVVVEGIECYVTEAAA